MPVSPRPKRSSSSISPPSSIPALPTIPLQTTTSMMMKPMSISSGSGHGGGGGSSSNNSSNSTGNYFSSPLPSSSSPRIRKFQMCMWITLILAFVHLISKPSIEVPPEDHTIKKKRPSNDSNKHSSTDNTEITPSSTTSTTHSNDDRTEIISQEKPIQLPTPAPSYHGHGESKSPSLSTTSRKSEKNKKTTKKDKKSPPPTLTNDSMKEVGVDDGDDPDKTIKKTGKDNKGSTTKRDEDSDVFIEETEPLLTPSPMTSKPQPLVPTEPTPQPLPPDPSSFSVLPSKNQKDVSDAARVFVEKHCDMTGFNPPDSTNWYPTGDNSWQQRAPYFIIAGVWNSGINDLSRTLLTYHPQIASSKIPGFFLPKQFYHYYKLVPTSIATTEVSSVKVFAARNKMYASVYSRSALRGNNDSGGSDNTNGNGNDSSSNKNTQVAMDVSPGLIFYAHTAAHSILCVAPWTKIVVLLRNPIDRVYKQWLYSKSNLGLKLSLEDWMAQEMQLMHDVGLIDAAAAAATSGSRTTTGQNQRRDLTDDGSDGESTIVVPESEAWNKYQSLRGMPKSIGRSLYVLQLEEWINAFREAGMNPADEMIVLVSEEVEAHPQEQYTKLFDFLGLAPANVTAPVRTPTPASSEPMKDETRKILHAFFRPYNQRLKKLLKDNGFKGDWGKLW